MRGRTCILGAARRLSRTAVFLALPLAFLALQLPAPALAAEPCPNAAFRTGWSARLPDCRAYELVSTARTNEQDIASGLVTADGLHVSYGTSQTEASVFSSTGGDWVAERTPAGWASSNLSLPGDELEGTGGPLNGGDPFPVFGALSEDGSRGVYITVHALDPADTNEALDVYEGSPESGFRWLTEDAIRGSLYGVGGTDMEYEGSSGDLSTVVFQAHQQLLPEAPAHLTGEGTGREIYQWHEGRLGLVSVLPGETTGAPGGAAVGSGPANGANLNAVSADGSRVFFESPDPTYNPSTPPQLYVRVDGERTVEVSAPAPGVTDPEGPKPATYVGATPDGSKVFFMSTGALTSNANTYYDTVEDLYEYDFASGTLTDISSAGLTSPEGSQVQGTVGLSENGGMVYFVAKGQLTSQATEGAYNLYLWKNGAITYVAALNEEDVGDWSLESRARPADVTPDGEHLAFISLNRLTAYENNGNPEMYKYDAESGTLACVSCNVSGAPPTARGVAYNKGFDAFNGTPRFMSNDGSEVFFDTTEALVAAASNGLKNVYEYEGGRQYLISTGTSSGASEFASMTPDGKDVFFLTRQPLVPSAGGENIQLYDARVDGGFPAPALLACTGTGCQGVPPAPPIFATPPSVTFSGLGNFPAPAPVVPAKPKVKKKPVKCARGKKLSHGKCVKTKAKRKRKAKAKKTSNNRMAKR